MDVVGFDDIEAARLSVPSLTAMAPGKETNADTAGSLPIDRIDRIDRPAVRKSTGGHL